MAARRTIEERRAALEAQLAELDTKGVEQKQSKIEKLTEKRAALDVKIAKLEEQRADLDTEIGKLSIADSGTVTFSDGNA